MRGADPRRNSSNRNSRRPGGRNDGSAQSRRGYVKQHHTGHHPAVSEAHQQEQTSASEATRPTSPDSVAAPQANPAGSSSREPSREQAGPSRGAATRASAAARNRPAAATTRNRESVATASRTSPTARSLSPGDRIKEYISGIDKARARHFGLSVIGADGSVVLAAVVLAVLGVVIAGAGFVVVPASIASIWMLFNLGGIGYNGTILSLLPALPAMLMVAFIAWRVRREVAGRVSIRDVRALVGTYLVVPMLLTFIAWLMLVDASNVLQRLKVPNLAMALGSTLVLHATAIVIGMGQRLIRALLRRRSWPEWLILSGRLAAKYVLWLGIAGLLVSLISLGWHFGTFREAYAITDSFSDKVLLTLLSIAYLPNIALGAVGVLVGAPVNMGPAEVTLFTVTPGILPPLPALAAMPQSHVSSAFGVLLVVPVIVAVVCVLRLLRSVRIDRPYIVVVTGAAMAGVFTALLALVFSGEVGIYGWTGPSWWLTALLSSVWMAAPGAIVVAATMGLPTRADDEAEPDVVAEKLPADEGDDEASDEGADAPEAGGENTDEAEQAGTAEESSEAAVESAEAESEEVSEEAADNEETVEESDEETAESAESELATNETESYTTEAEDEDVAAEVAAASDTESEEDPDEDESEEDKDKGAEE